MLGKIYKITNKINEAFLVKKLEKFIILIKVQFVIYLNDII